MTELKAIDQDVPKGKRLLFTDAAGEKREFHGPCSVGMKIPTANAVQLVDELPPRPDTRTDYEKLSLNERFESLREHLKVTKEQVVTAASLAAN